MEIKVCTRCKESKPLENFYKCKKTDDGYRWECKECGAIYAREWGQKNKPWKTAKVMEWRKKNAHRWRAYVKKYQIKNREQWKLTQRKTQLKIKYNLTIEGYEAIYKSQNGACAICKGQGYDGKRLAVDHNHNTGQIRGLLCGSCNNGLGRFKESQETLQNAIDYLNKHEAKQETENGQTR